MYGFQRARPAGPEHAYPSSHAKLPYLALSFLKIAYWSIFKKEMKAMGAILMKMAVLPKGNALRPVENHDMESFPI